MRRTFGASGLALAVAFAVAAAGAQAAEPIAIPDVPPAGLWITSGAGAVRVLDKQKAETRLLHLKVGETATYETLGITLVACMAHAPGVPSDSAGFLRIVDSRPDEPGFSGWMLQQEPGLAMLESPVYAVRVAGCERPSDAALAAALPPPAKPDATPKPAAEPAHESTPAPDTSLSAPPAPELDAPPAAEPPPSDPGGQ